MIYPIDPFIVKAWEPKILGPYFSLGWEAKIPTMFKLFIFRDMLL